MSACVERELQVPLCCLCSCRPGLCSTRDGVPCMQHGGDSCWHVCTPCMCAHGTVENMPALPCNCRSGVSGCWPVDGGGRGCGCCAEPKLDRRAYAAFTRCGALALLRHRWQPCIIWVWLNGSLRQPPRALSAAACGHVLASASLAASPRLCA